MIGSSVEPGDTEKQRVERMRETWRALEPTAGEIAAAQARMVRRAKDARRPARVLPAMVAVASVLAAAAAFAGVRAGVLRQLILGSRAVAPEVPMATTSMSTARSSPPTPTTTPSMETPTPSEPDAVDPESLPLVVDPAPSARMHPVVAPSSSAMAPTPSASAATTHGGWAAAAEALRAGDYALADRAFGELAASGDPRTRDEARLARAQVWIAQRRNADARRELEQLAASGATTLVRARASDMLRSMRQGSSDRGAPGTNSP
jgi:hypothetical protein